MPDFLFGLNTSTIQPTPLLDKIRIAAEAGYDAVELWAADVEQYLERGGLLGDLRHALDDRRLLRPSMIALKEWCVPPGEQSPAALDLIRRRLDVARQLEVRRIVATPPRGPAEEDLVAECYAKLLALSLEYGVPASLEFLGFAQSVSTLEQAWRICRAVDHPQATLTLDAWHLFRGGSNPKTLDGIPAEKISPCCHWNDAPASPPRETQTDADRVMPGDGILDLPSLAGQLRRLEWRGVLCLELFHPGYWERDPLETAALGLKKMRSGLEGEEGS